MTPHRAIPLTVAVVLAATPAGAQRIELSPSVGLRFGGDFETTDGFHFDDLGLAVDDGSSLGVEVAYAVSRHLHVGILYSHQDSRLLDDRGFLREDTPLFDIDVDYTHLTAAYQWGRGQLHPFIALGLGITELDAEPPGVEDETRFSVSVGGGVKLFFNRRFGIRLELRGYNTALDTDSEVFCDRFGCDHFLSEDLMIQGELRGGLLFAF